MSDDLIDRAKAAMGGDMIDLASASRQLVPDLIAALEARDARIAEFGLDALAAHTQADEAYQARLAAEARVKVLEELVRRAQRLVDPCCPWSHLSWQDDARAALEGEK